jgi:hypothetical protein
VKASGVAGDLGSAVVGDDSEERQVINDCHCLTRSTAA